MARVQVELPEQFNFSTEIPIRISDVNYGGHVGNDSVLTLAHEARVRFLKAAGYGELQLEGIGIIVIDAAIEYKNELFYGDTVTVAVKAINFSKAGFEIYYKLEKQTEKGKVLVAKIKTGILTFDYSKKKIANIPATAVEKISAL
jgi:acyl-CoA thioester hydrolase